MSGKLVVIEGLDGCGKETQSKRLLASLIESGVDARAISFPRYESDSSALVRMYLRGDFGSNARDVNCYAASTFYSVDRYASYKAEWGSAYEDGALFVLDRYTTSNAVFQGAKLQDSERDNFFEWLFSFEYGKLGMPEPDKVIYLDMSPETSGALLRGRYGGDESQKDIHERDKEFQCDCRASALQCAAVQNWHIIECDSGGRLRSVDDIAADILRAAREIL
ncbi:MAG: thymidylate kinase [Oscillospiraceae bacterium]